MKRINTLFALTLAFVTLLVATEMCQAQNYPKPIGYMNDFAQTLTKEDSQQLNAELIEFEKKTSIEISVINISSLNGADIETYTRGIASAWGVGKKYQDNGIVFLIALKERKMRIQTASGVRATLPSSKTDKIRDINILPHFRSGNMALGIIEGTRAIMQSINGANAITPEKGDSSQQKEQTSAVATIVPADSQTAQKNHESIILASILGIFVGTFIILMLISGVLGISKARKYVLEQKKLLPARFVKVEKKIKHPDVNTKHHAQLKNLQNQFDSIVQDLATTKGNEWLKMQSKIAYICDSLDRIGWVADEEISSAKATRKKGPELMKKLPAMIKTAESKIASGNQSPKALKQLEEAKRQYTEAQKQSETGTDWLLLWVLLNNAQSNITQAETSHDDANIANRELSPSAYPHVSSSNTSSSDPSPVTYSPSSNDSSGFGGGSGFDSGTSNVPDSSGTTGSW